MNLAPSLALRLNPVDKAALVELSARLQRSQTDTVRILVRETLAILKEQDAARQAEQQQTTSRARANTRGA